jgi:transcriptional regulator with XRE-family HTH domain
MQAEEEVQSVFGQRLQEAMTRAGMGKRRLARILGTAESTVYRWISGDNEPLASTVAELAVHLNVSADWLLGIEETSQFWTADKIAALFSISPSTAERMVEVMGDRATRVYLNGGNPNRLKLRTIHLVKDARTTPARTSSAGRSRESLRRPA